VYDFRDGSQRGLTESNGIMVRWDAGRDTWVAISKFGGAPYAEALGTTQKRRRRTRKAVERGAVQRVTFTGEHVDRDVRAAVFAHERHVFGKHDRVRGIGQQQ